jgi:hypothetical protein
MASHFENAAEHLAAAMLSDPGSDEAVRETCAAIVFGHAAENDPTTKESA